MSEIWATFENVLLSSAKDLSARASLGRSRLGQKARDPSFAGPIGCTQATVRTGALTALAQSDIEIGPRFAPESGIL